MLNEKFPTQHLSFLVGELCTSIDVTKVYFMLFALSLTS